MTLKSQTGMSQREAPIPGGELAAVHSYLMRAALSTSLPVQLTQLHLAKTDQSALLLHGHQCSTLKTKEQVR